MGSDLDSSSDLPLETAASNPQLLVDCCGFNPVEAIVVATKNGAAACVMRERRETIEVGEFANLIIVDDQPSRDVGLSTKRPDPTRDSGGD